MKLEIFKIYFLLFILYSFLGWIMEDIYCYFDTGKMINRGFLIGPICPIYGIGCLLLVFLLNKYINEPLALFAISIIICSLLEYITSYILEKLFKVRWWDYSHLKYNINGRICMETMVPFGIIGTLMVCFVNPFFFNLFTKMPHLVINISFYFILLIFIIDLCISLKVVSNIKNITSNIIKDNTEEINTNFRAQVLNKIRKFRFNKESIDKKIRKVLGQQSYLTKRIINVFPRYKVSNLIKKVKKGDKDGKEDS